MGPATDAERQMSSRADINHTRYAKPIDPRSAHEVLSERIAARQEQARGAELAERAAKAERRASRRSNRRDSAGETFLKSIARAAGSSVGRKLFRGILGSLLK